MKYDADFLKPTTGLPSAIAARMDELKQQRRRAGLNVQFIRETDGRRDEYSFADESRRNKFIASLKRRGIPHAISE